MKRIEFLDEEIVARLAELIIERIESKNQIPNREIRFTTTILPGNGVGVPREQ